MKLRFFCACVLTLASVLGDHVSAASEPKKGLDPPHADRTEVTYRGGRVTPPLPKPRFTLTDTSEAPFDFWRKTEGYVALLFFGYARCPDQCPLHMANIAGSLQNLPKGIADQVKVVFVTTDPTRDSPKVLRLWLDRFVERFICLTRSDTGIAGAPRACWVASSSKRMLSR